MGSYTLLIIFILIWVTIGSYLVYLDHKVKKLKQMLSLKQELRKK
ncbi:MAG TPA: CcmD family protein [Caldithrix sp.]|nr:CcmD family protein [Caldithrix sp.]